MFYINIPVHSWTTW